MRLLAILILMSSAVLLVAADQPEPGTITRADNGAQLEARVLSETLDEVLYVLGEGAATANTSMPRTRVRRIEYGPITDLDYNRAMGDRNSGNHERAATRFLQSAAASLHMRVRELAYIEAARSFLETQKPDEALKALAELQSKGPRSVQLPNALQMKARILVSQQNLAGAEAAAVELAKLAPLQASVLRAEILRGQGKAKEAVEQLRLVWGAQLTARTEVVDGQPTFAEVGFLLAGDLEKAGDEAGMRAIYDALAFAPIARAEQARAHRLLAESLTRVGDKASLIQAFDHALIAGGLARTERAAARRLCQRIIAEFDKDDAMKADVAEYRTYVNTL